MILVSHDLNRSASSARGASGSSTASSSPTGPIEDVIHQYLAWTAAQTAASA